MFSRVYAELACERCGGADDFEVQFKTGNDRDMARYEAGEVVAGLAPGASYLGIADAYCADCMERWIVDEKIASFEALARSISLGEIIARSARSDADWQRPGSAGSFTVLREAPLTPDEVRQLAERPDRDFVAEDLSSRLSHAEVLLFTIGGVLVSIADAWWTDHLGKVEQRLASMGWRVPATHSFRDVTVQIEPDGRIAVVPLKH